MTSTGPTPSKAPTVYGDLVRLCGEPPEPGLRQQLAASLINKGVALRELGQLPAVIAACDDIVKRFGMLLSLSSESWSLGRWPRREARLAALEQYQAAIINWDDIVKRFSDADEPACRKEAAEALSAKCVVLKLAGKAQDAIAACDDFVERFGDVPEPHFRSAGAVMLSLKGSILQELGEQQAAVAAYDDVVARFGNAPEAELQLAVVKALYGKVRTSDLSDPRRPSSLAMTSFGASAIPPSQSSASGWPGR